MALESAGYSLVTRPTAAHPGLMGSLGLHRFLAQHHCRPGWPARHLDLLEWRWQPAATHAATMVRRLPPNSECCWPWRNPPPASYVRRHAAVGGLTYAMRWRGAVLAFGLSETLLHAIHGGRLPRARSLPCNLQPRGLSIGPRPAVLAGSTSIAICNEYMMVAKEHMPLPCFDLVVLFDEASRWARSSATGHVAVLACRASGWVQIRSRPLPRPSNPPL
jgi:hypothetical protein